MIRIEPDAWEVMVAEGRRTFPNECCGAMLGDVEDGVKIVRVAMPLRNSFSGSQATFYELSKDDFLSADREAGRLNLNVIGFYHSHPDHDAYFSASDLQHSCPWYTYVVLSIRRGEFDHANSWLPDPDAGKAEKEELIY
jgi:proteasome lid subunit RPN8/RPN11